MKTQLVIEKSTDADNNIKSIYSVTKIKSRENLVSNFNRYLPSLKSGSGGSHVWISNMDNERLAIVYLK